MRRGGGWTSIGWVGGDEHRVVAVGATLRCALGAALPAASQRLLPPFPHHQPPAWGFCMYGLSKEYCIRMGKGARGTMPHVPSFGMSTGSIPTIPDSAPAGLRRRSPETQPRDDSALPHYGLLMLEGQSPRGVSPRAVRGLRFPSQTRT